MSYKYATRMARLDRRDLPVTAEKFLKDIDRILVIDWPSREVPELLAFAGFQVLVRGGPGPEDYSAYEASDGKVTSRRTGRAPDRAGLIFAFRPLAELPQIIATARSLHAKAIWTQSGITEGGAKDPKGCWLPPADLQAAKAMVESAGLIYISEPYIGDVARKLAANERE